MAKDEDSTNGNGNGNGGPWWAKLIGYIGVPGFLLFFLLGGLQTLGVPSPILKINELSADMKGHRRETKRLINVYRLTCRGVWQGSQPDQNRCDDAAHGLLEEEPRP